MTARVGLRSSRRSSPPPESTRTEASAALVPDTYNHQPLHLRLQSVIDENGAARERRRMSTSASIVSRRLVRARTTEWRDPRTRERDRLPTPGWSSTGTSTASTAQLFGVVTARLHLDAGLVRSRRGWRYQGGQAASMACASITSQTVPDRGVASSRHRPGRWPCTRRSRCRWGSCRGPSALFDDNCSISPSGWIQGVGVLAGLGGRHDPRAEARPARR